jgi:phytoene/squalene synthetase
LAQTGVSAAHACDLLRAFRRDATKTRYANWNELYDYCRFSAMPVGRHVLDLHGEAPRTHAPSDALCVALQVLNHLQDCARDLAALDRCYLPADRLAKHGAAVTDLQRPVETPGLRRVFGELLDHVDALNKTAASLPGGVRDWRLRVETAGIVNLSRALATRLRRGDPLATRVKLSRGDMVFSLATAMKSLL